MPNGRFAEYETRLREIACRLGDEGMACNCWQKVPYPRRKEGAWFAVKKSGFHLSVMEPEKRKEKGARLTFG